MGSLILRGHPGVGLAGTLKTHLSAAGEGPRVPTGTAGGSLEHHHPGAGRCLSGCPVPSRGSQQAALASPGGAGPRVSVFPCCFPVLDECETRGQSPPSSLRFHFRIVRHTWILTFDAPNPPRLFLPLMLHCPLRVHGHLSQGSAVIAVAKQTPPCSCSGEQQTGACPLRARCGHFPLPAPRLGSHTSKALRVQSLGLSV